jgi:hypothetical protein
MDRVLIWAIRRSCEKAMCEGRSPAIFIYLATPAKGLLENSNQQSMSGGGTDLMYAALLPPGHLLRTNEFVEPTPVYPSQSLLE